MVEIRYQSVFIVEKHDGRFSSAVPDFHSRGSIVGVVAPESPLHAHVEDTIGDRRKLLPHIADPRILSWGTETETDSA